MGDLPVPPTERLPIQITGRPKLVESKIFLSYSQLRTPTPSQYNKAKGNKSIRNDFRKKLENINGLRRNTKVQRYVKFIAVIDPVNRFKIAETCLDTVFAATGKIFIIKPLSIANTVPAGINHK